MEKHKIAIIVGSLRKESVNRKMAQAMCGIAGDSLDCSIVEIGDLALFNQDIEANPPAEWVAFKQAITAADGVLFVTPEYNRTIPGALKNAIDVGSRPYGKAPLADKPCAVVSVSPGVLGGFGANHHLRQSLVFLNVPLLSQEAYIGNVFSLFGENGELINEGTAAFLKAYGAALKAWNRSPVRRFVVRSSSGSAMEPLVEPFAPMSAA